MKRGLSAALRTFGLALAGLTITSGHLLADQVQGGGNGSGAAVPTLDGVGLLALAGALSAGGAWLLSRNRDKQK